MTQMDFGDALRSLKVGLQVTRAGWNGKDMHLQYVPAVKTPDGSFLAYIQMKTAQGDLVPWLASQSDILDTDWQVLDVQPETNEVETPAEGESVSGASEQETTDMILEPSVPPATAPETQKLEALEE